MPSIFSDDIISIWTAPPIIKAGTLWAQTSPQPIYKYLFVFSAITRQQNELKIREGSPSHLLAGSRSGQMVMARRLWPVTPCLSACWLWPRPGSPGLPSCSLQSRLRSGSQSVPLQPTAGSLSLWWDGHRGWPWSPLQGGDVISTRGHHEMDT